MRNNIALLRKSKGLTQKDLAEMIGITHWHLNHIENNKRNPSIEVTKNIAEILGVTMKDIFLD